MVPIRINLKRQSKSNLDFVSLDRGYWPFFFFFSRTAFVMKRSVHIFIFGACWYFSFDWCWSISFVGGKRFLFYHCSKKHTWVSISVHANNSSFFFKFMNESITNDETKQVYFRKKCSKNERKKNIPYVYFFNPDIQQFWDIYLSSLEKSVVFHVMKCLMKIWMENVKSLPLT